MIPPRLLRLLVAGSVVLPIVVVVVAAVGRLLLAMGDAGGGEFLERIALAAGVFWLLDLVFLVVSLGVNSSGPDE